MLSLKLRKTEKNNGKAYYGIQQRRPGVGERTEKAEVKICSERQLQLDLSFIEDEIRYQGT